MQPDLASIAGGLAYLNQGWWFWATKPGRVLMEAMSWTAAGLSVVLLPFANIGGGNEAALGRMMSGAAGSVRVRYPFWSGSK